MTSRKNLDNYKQGAPYDDRTSDLGVQTNLEAIELLARDYAKPNAAAIAVLQSDIAGVTESPVFDYYIDGSRTDSYTENGSIARPFKTLAAAATATNASAAALIAAGTYGLARYQWHVASGTYSDNFTLTNEKCLRIVGTGVTISGNITLTQTQQSGDYYSRLEFVGCSGNRAEKGDAFKITGTITGTRNNDSLTYVVFSGVYVSGAVSFQTNGTWVVSVINSRIAGQIEGDFSGAGTPQVLICTEGYASISGKIAKISDDSATMVTLYECSELVYSGSLINITPAFDCTLKNCSFTAGTISIVATKNLNVDGVSLKSLIARTPTLTGMTIVYLEKEATADYKGVAALASQAEVNAGTDAAKIITPATFQNSMQVAAIAPLLTERHTGTVTTADDVATEIAWVGIEADKAYDINAKVVGFLSDGDVAYSAEVAVAARRKTGGNATIAGTITELHAKGDAGASAWAVTAEADTSAQHIKIKVTGSQEITEAGDSGNQLASWSVAGVTAANSDNYVLYYALSDSTGDRTVSLFADDAGVTKVAEGMRTGDGTITLAEVAGSGVSGSVDVTYTGDITVGAGKTLTFKTVNWACTATATEVSL